MVSVFYTHTYIYGCIDLDTKTYTPISVYIPKLKHTSVVLYIHPKTYLWLLSLVSRTQASHFLYLTNILINTNQHCQHINLG